MEEEIEKDVKTILIVDDEQPIRDILVYNLEKEGYKTIEAADGVTAVNMALSEKPDLILLDIMLPKLDGLSVCKRIKNSYNVPILMLTVARVKANLRKVEALSIPQVNESTDDSKKKTNKIVVGDLELDLDKFEVKVRGEVIDLTLREFEVLKFLANDPRTSCN